MGLSCSCDDFDKSDFERWWEPGGKSVPPAWSRCCECNAPLPPEKHDCIVHMEVYDPGEIEPLHTMAAFGGKLFIAFALFGLIGHIETHLMEAIIRAVDIIGPRAKRIGWAIILPFWIVAMVVLAPILFRGADAEVEKDG